MAAVLTDLEEKRMEQLVAALIERRRPPLHVRKDLDLGFRISGQSVVIVEVRPHWRRSEEKMEQRIAKATLARSKSVWRVFWQRRDLKWHLYEPAPEVDTL